jgi:hypothetical protein
MTNEEITALLAKLEYSSKWRDYGFLDGDFLREQGEDFDTSGDKNTEHYRWAAFRAYLGYHRSLDSVQLSHYIDLAVSDSDKAMGEAALGMLLQWPGLTPEQFDLLTQHPAFQRPFLQKMATRKRLLSEVGRTPLDSASVARFLDSGDDAVFQALLDRADIPRETLERIRDVAPNANLRRAAEARLRIAGPVEDGSLAE